MINNKDNISVLRINRLKGRMLYVPAPKGKKREILLVYGHHASLERMFGIAANLNNYGAVTIPDLPGFGGMESLHKIGLQPSVDNFADYLAAFIKLRYKRKRITVVAMSFSFLIVTRMLQKYPDIAKKVDVLVSSVGFVHHEDFRLPKYQQTGLKLLGAIFQYRFSAFLFRHLLLNSLVIRGYYNFVGTGHSKMQDAEDKDVKRQRINAEIKLWQINDVRTRMYTLAEMFRIDLCAQKVNLPVHHVFVDSDRFFNNKVVEQHMRIIYSDFIGLTTDIKGHMPSIVASADDAEPFVPPKLKRLLR